MAGPTLSSNVSNVLETYIVAAKTTNEFGPVMRSLMWNLPLPKRKGTSVNIPKFGQLTAYQFSRGTKIDQQQQLATSNTQISPISVGVHVLLDEYAEDVANESLIAREGQLASEAMNRFEDKDLLTLLDGFSNSLGAAGTAKPGYLIAAYTNIWGGQDGTQEPMLPPYNCLLSPFHWHAIAEDIGGLMSGSFVAVATSTATSSYAETTDVGSIREMVLQKYLVKNFAGLNIYLDGNLTPSGGSCKGGVWATDALVYVPFRPYRTKTMEDIQMDGWHIVSTMIYGRGEYLDSGGVELNLQAVQATA